MPSHLEVALASLASLDTCELDFVRSSISNHLKTRKDAVASPPCRLLNLPAELRNRIYEYAIAAHLKHADNICKKPGLLESNKQIRREFGDIYYGKETMAMKYASNLESTKDTHEVTWTCITNQHLIQAILSGNSKSVIRTNRCTAAIISAKFASWNLIYNCRSQEHTGLRVGVVEETWMGRGTEQRFLMVNLDMELLEQYGYKCVSVLKQGE